MMYAPASRLRRAGVQTDPYGFKPTDLVVDYDDSLLISDWCDGQRPKRGRGRIYRVRYVGDSAERVPAPARVDLNQLSIGDLIARLDSASHHQRVAAQIELQRRGDEVLPQLRQQLRDASLGVNPNGTGLYAKRPKPRFLRGF